MEKKIILCKKYDDIRWFDGSEDPDPDNLGREIDKKFQTVPYFWARIRPG